MGDVTIKQKTEHSRLFALMKSVKLSSLDFSSANVKVDFNSKAQNVQDCSREDKDVSLVITYSNFALDF